jgi:hypothetical protein
MADLTDWGGGAAEGAQSLPPHGDDSPYVAAKLTRMVQCHFMKSMVLRLLRMPFIPQIR